MSKGLFKVEFFCDESKLGTALRALAGIAYDVKPTPVINAHQRNGLVKATSPHATVSNELVLEHLKKKGLKTFVAKEVKDALRELGRSTSSYSHIMNSLVDKKLLKREANKRKGSKGRPEFQWSIVESH